ncbi:MAG TPA: ABC transporter permease, partial [Candidatus Saccharimonadales bacterium]
MKLSDYLRLAFRNIRRQKLRSALTIFAVVIGAMSVTIMLALVTGAKSFFLSQVQANGMLQQVAVSPKADITNFQDAGHSGGNCDGCVKLTDTLTDKIKSISHVVGVARVVQDGTLEAISYGNKKLSTQQTTAYDANGIIDNNILAGRDIKDSDTEGVITITSDYADKFGFKGNYQGLVGKTVQLQTRSFYTGVGANIQPPPTQNGPGNPGNQPQSQPPTILTATILGIVDTSNSSATIRVPLPWMRGMEENRMYQMTAADQAAQNAECRNTRGPCNTTPHYTLVVQDMLAQNGYSSLIAKADTSQDAAGVAKSIKKLGVGAADAEASIKQQLTVFNIMGLVLGGIGGIALAVAAIGVVNTMI